MFCVLWDVIIICRRVSGSDIYLSKITFFFSNDISFMLREVMLKDVTLSLHVRLSEFQSNEWFFKLILPTYDHVTNPTLCCVNH